MGLLNLIRKHKHTWTDWEYISEGSAIQERNCKCKSTEKRIKYEWGEWEYIKEGECNMKRICKRTGKTEERSEIHLLKNWKYIEEASCAQEGICERCGIVASRKNHIWKKETEIDGDWGYKGGVSWETTRTITFEKCTRCREETSKKTISEETRNF